MWIVDKYIDYVKEQTEKTPEQSFDKILLGFKANKLRTKVLPNGNLGRGYQKLESMMMSLVADSLGKPDSYVWGNIFAPCEIMQCFDLATLSVECLACYLSGYHLWRIISLTMPRARESPRPCAPTIRPLWGPLTAGRCPCPGMR